MPQETQAVRRGSCPLREAGTPVFAVGEVSHDWLFPQLAAVVHHGGSGTTHRAVLAGVPSMAVPVGYDRPYWGRRLAELGVAVPPVPYRKLSPARLASAIGQLTGDPGIAARAKQLGAVLSAENGASAAARIIMAELAAQATRGSHQDACRDRPPRPEGIESTSCGA